MMKILTLTAAALLAASWTCAAPETAVFHLNEPFEKEFTYSQAVRVGDTLYVSGIASAGPIEQGIKHSYEGLGKVLAAHGLNFTNVVKETVYTTDIEGLKKNRAVRKAFYGAEGPAATWVQVQQLFNPDLVIEVELIAVFPKR